MVFIALFLAALLIGFLIAVIPAFIEKPRKGYEFGPMDPMSGESGRIDARIAKEIEENADVKAEYHASSSFN